MSGDWRSTLVAVYDHLYTNIGDRGGFCTYCGIPSETMDHVPPLSLTNMLNERAKSELEFIKVPACGECNSVLGNVSLLSIRDRRLYVRRKYKAKYKKALNMPKWDEDELAEINPLMADDIRRASIRAEWVKGRITWVSPPELDDLDVTADQ